MDCIPLPHFIGYSKLSESGDTL